VLEGQTAGYNMAGEKTEYCGGTNMSSLKYFGVPIVSIGMSNPKDDPTLEILTKHEPQKVVYKKIVLKDNVIVGLTLLGNIDKAGLLYKLMKEAVNVKKYKPKLLADDFSLAALPNSLQKKIGVTI
jgi:NAD(P)H-nitrite reductase large subunit